MCREIPDKSSEHSSAASLGRRAAGEGPHSFSATGFSAPTGGSAALETAHCF